MGVVTMGERLPAVFSPQTWGFSLDELPPEACLVGGAVRDALLGRRSDYLDLDFVVPHGAIETARSLARNHNAGFVVLDAERQIARVVFPHATLDFALQEGESLECDLRRRDFTVNAIAYNPRSQKLVDPLHGYEDLQRRQLRTIARRNLEDDPLRLLRGYRQAAQLGFTLERETRQTIRQLAPRLNSVAAERVNSELGYLLGSDRGTPWLQVAWQDGLLSGWFPSANDDRVARLRDVDGAAQQLSGDFPALVEALQVSLRPTLKTTAVTIAKLTNLVSEAGDRAESELLRLKYARAEVRSTLAVRQAWESAPGTAALQQMSVRSQYFWFKALDDSFPAYAVYAVSLGVSLAAIAPYIRRYLTPNDPVAHPQPLVNGRDLIETAGVPRGPDVGRWLTEIAIAHAEGKIDSPEAALAWVKDAMTSNSQYQE